MASEEKEELKELVKRQKVLKKKIVKRRIKRGILIVLNAVLVSYLVYCLYDTGKEFYLKNFESEGNIISLGGLSEAKSLELYKDVIDYDETSNTFNTTEAVDYSFYAGYLSFKSENDVKNADGSLKISSFNTYTLRYVDLTSVQKENPYKDVGTYINNSIYLFDENLRTGDYLVYPYEYKIDEQDLKKEPIKIESQTGINQTYYSPIIVNQRKQITIKSKSSSPCLIITIKNIFVPETTYNDLAILYDTDNQKEAISQTFNSNTFAIKYISNKNNIKENLISLYQAKSIVTLIIEDEDTLLLSHYIDVASFNFSFEITNCPLSSETNISLYDEDVYIRELGGHLFNAGGALSTQDGSTKYLASYINKYDMGSLTIHISINHLNDLKDLLTSLVNFNFN